MAYTSVATVKTLLPGTLPASLTDPIIEGFIADADAEIDATLTTLYTVPFASTPALVASVSKHLSADKCRAFLGLANRSEADTAYGKIGHDILATLGWQSDGSLPKVRMTGFAPASAISIGTVKTGDDNEDTREWERSDLG